MSSRHPHLILTGFMGTGKTTIGKILAKSLRLPFIDLDEAIAKATGLTPQQTILRFGEPAFRKIEKRILKKILEEETFVLATGGGTVLDSQNRRWLKKKGFVVSLETPLALLRPRLQKTKGRPLLPQPFSVPALQKMIASRKKFYRDAHFRITNAFAPPKSVAIPICDRYKAYLNAPRAPK